MCKGQGTSQSIAARTGSKTHSLSNHVPAVNMIRNGEFTMYRTLTVLASGMSLLLATPALAHSSAGQPPSLVVRYSDLDVTRRDGARALLDRLSHAAHRVCSPEPDNKDLHGRTLYDACVRDSMDRAVAAVHIPLVSALYFGPPSIAQNPGDIAR